MLNAARRRSTQKDLPCTLTHSWVLERLQEGRCELSGLPFDYQAKKGHLSPLTPSVDRIVPQLGYTPQNCRIVCQALNALFSTWGEAASLEIVIAYLKNRGVHFE